MGLKLYYKNDNDEFVQVSSDTDDGLDPLVSVHDGKKGSVVTKQLYLRNDDSAKWYSNIIVKPVDTVGADPYGDVAYNETGWGVKLSDQENEPSVFEWDDINWGQEIDMLDIGSDSLADTTTYYPFWYLESCPPNEDVKIKDDIVINVAYTENAVI